MRKRLHSIPPALNHGSRPNPAAASHPKWRRPNALKHGVFAETPLIPGEDRREFDQLYAALIDEWNPSGITLEFALRGLAESMWRLRRLKKFTQTRLSLTMFDRHSPSFDEVWGLGMFIGGLRSEPETFFEQHANKYLLPDKIDHLKQKIPRSIYQTTSDWVKAVITESMLVLYPDIDAGKSLKAAELDEEVAELGVDVVEAACEWKTEQKVAGCMIYASEILEYDSKETERLNAMIVKQTRHCAALKAWEDAEEMRSKT